MTVHYSATGLSDGAELGTPGAGTLTDADIVFPNGHICKITAGYHESTHQFGNHGLDYNEDMSTNTSDKPYAIDPTACDSTIPGWITRPQSKAHVTRFTLT